MGKDERKFLSKISDKTKINIARFWFSGAIFYFIGWGTDLGLNSDSLDLMFVLGLVIGIGNIFILHPLVYSMFDVERDGKLVNKKYYERTIFEGVLVKFGEIIKCIIGSYLTALIYIVFNLLCIKIFDLSNDTIILSGEPIIYGIIFTLWYVGMTKISIIIKKVFSKIVNFIKEKKANKSNDTTDNQQNQNINNDDIDDQN